MTVLKASEFSGRQHQIGPFLIAQSYLCWPLDDDPRAIRNLFIKNSDQEKPRVYMSKCSSVINLRLPCKDVIQYPNKASSSFFFFFWFGYFIQSNQAFISKMFPIRWLQPSCSSPPNFLRPHAHPSQRKLKLDIFLVWKRLAKIKQELKYCYNLTPLLLFIFQLCL